MNPAPAEGRPFFFAEYTKCGRKGEEIVTAGIDYTQVIRDLEERRARMNAQYDALIGGLRQVMGMQAPAIQPSLLPSEGADNGIAKPYAKGSMIEVAIKHLSTRGGGPVPNLELAKALNDGGFPHKSKNFPNTLNSVLWRRARTVGDIRKNDDGWEIVRHVSLRPSDAVAE